MPAINRWVIEEVEDEDDDDDLSLSCQRNEVLAGPPILQPPHRPRGDTGYIPEPLHFLANTRALTDDLATLDPASVVRHNRLELLKPFLERLVSKGSIDPAVHNALGKIIVDSNNNAQHFLTTNPYYDSQVVGRYCEERDPNLACVAYKRGSCDEALVACTNRHSLFKVQARYILERMDSDLWAKVLEEDNPFRRQLIDQVVFMALPESNNQEQVSVAAQAFMQAGLQEALIQLLEETVLPHNFLRRNSSLSINRTLQNLLIITAIKADKSRVKGYIHRLDNFDGLAVAKIALDYEMFGEAFDIYRKFGLMAQAISMLLDNQDNLERALEYATETLQDQLGGDAELQRWLTAAKTLVDDLAAWDPIQATIVWLRQRLGRSKRRQFGANLARLCLAKRPAIIHPFKDESHVEGLDYSLVGAALMAGVGDGMELEHDAGTGRFVLCQRLSFEQLRALLAELDDAAAHGIAHAGSRRRWTEDDWSRLRGEGWAERASCVQEALEALRQPVRAVTDLPREDADNGGAWITPLLQNRTTAKWLLKKLCSPSWAEVFFYPQVGYMVYRAGREVSQIRCAAAKEVGAITYATGIPVEDQRLLKAMEDNGGEPELAPRLLGNARVHGSGSGVRRLQRSHSAPAIIDCSAALAITPARPISSVVLAAVRRVCVQGAARIADGMLAIACPLLAAAEEVLSTGSKTAPALPAPAAAEEPEASSEAAQVPAAVGLLRAGVRALYGAAGALAGATEGVLQHTIWWKK